MTSGDSTGHIFSDGSTRPLPDDVPWGGYAPPRIEERPAQPYLAIRAELTRPELVTATPVFQAELYDWMDPHGVNPTGPPLVRYLVSGSGPKLQVEIGLPIQDPVKPPGRIIAGVIPAGRYLVLTHRGTYDGLGEAHAALERFAARHGIAFEVQATEAGTAWSSRVEHYTVGPEIEIDPALWETEIACLTASQPEQPAQG
jgi:effector-binding domain-containing protein